MHLRLEMPASPMQPHHSNMIDQALMAVGYVSLLKRAKANDALGQGWGQNDSEAVISDMLAATKATTDEHETIAAFLVNEKLCNPSQTLQRLIKADQMPKAKARSEAANAKANKAKPVQKRDSIRPRIVSGGGFETNRRRH